MFNFLKSKEKPSPNKFILCSPNSTKYALSLIDKLTKYNDSSTLHFKSYMALDCSKDDLIKSIYFLKDLIIFCREDALYKNESLKSTIEFLYSHLLTYFLDVSVESIPKDKKENYAFGRKFKLLENIGPNELENLTRVDWRSEVHWKYWSDTYGKDDLGNYCEEMVTKTKT